MHNTRLNPDFSELSAECAKYSAILQLSVKQIAVIESGDFATLQAILSAKGALISSLRDGRALLAANPALRSVMQQIEQTEIQAEQALESRLTGVKQKLSAIHSAKSARRTYRKESRKLPAFVPSTETPMLFDMLS